MPSKLSEQIDIRPHDGQVERLIAARPRLVKIIGNRGLARILHAALPDTIIINRIASTELTKDDFSNYLGGDTPKNAADRWMYDMRHVLLECPFAYWEGFNEFSNWPLMRQFGEFEAERQRLMNLAGYKAAIGSFAVGTPEIVDPGDLWPLFYPALKACHDYQNILSLHEYGGMFMDMWMDGDTYNTFPEDRREGWLFGRYRKVHRKHIEPNGWTNIRIALTELGLDKVATDIVSKLAGSPVGPFRQCMPTWRDKFNRPDGEDFYFEQLCWADRQMQLDPFVVGATIFLHGTIDDEVWPAFDIHGRVADRLYSYIKANHSAPVPVPPPTPPPVPVPVPVPPPAPPPVVPKYVRTTTAGQNVRSLPGLTARIITVVRPTEKLEVIDLLPGWIKVRTPSNYVGWAVDYLLTPWTAPLPPSPVPNLYGTVVGLHGDANPSKVGWTQPVFNIYQQARMDGAKTLTGGDMDGSVIDRLRQSGVTFFMSRLFYKVTRPTSPNEFVQDVLPSARRLYGAGVRWFEVHNEPNLHTPSSPEGMWVNWNNGFDFAQWFIEVVRLLRLELPEAKFGYPGLSPGWDITAVRYDSERFLLESMAAVSAADFVCMHTYWGGSRSWGHSIADITFFCQRFPTKYIVVSEVSNSDGTISADEKGKQYVQFASEANTISKNLVAVFFFISSGFVGGEAWLGTNIPSIVGGRKDNPAPLPEPVPTPSPNPRQTYRTVSTSGLNMRRGSGTGYGIIKTLPANSVVYAAGERTSTWTKIIDQSGVVGWVASIYIREI